MLPELCLTFFNFEIECWLVPTKGKQDLNLAITPKTHLQPTPQKQLD